MLKEIKFKKEYGLSAASIIVLIISYQLVFKKTVAAWQFNSNLQKQIAQSSDASYQPGYLERKNANLEKIIDLYKADTVNYRSNILSVISAIAEGENVKLTEVPSQQPAFHMSEFTIQKLKFEGDYFALENTFNKLQQAKDIGMVRSAKISSIINHSNGGDVKKMEMELSLEILKR